MSLHSKDLVKKGNNLIMQRRELTLKPLPDSKTQGEKKNEEMSLFNALNLGNSELAEGRFLPPPPLLPETGPREVTTPPLYDEGMIFYLKTWQGTQFDQGASFSGLGQFSLRQYYTGVVNQEGQPLTTT